jgi:hypothetical protein
VSERPIGTVTPSSARRWPKYQHAAPILKRGYLMCGCISERHVRRSRHRGGVYVSRWCARLAKMECQPARRDSWAMVVGSHGKRVIVRCATSLEVSVWCTASDQGTRPLRSTAGSRRACRNSLLCRHPRAFTVLASVPTPSNRVRFARRHVARASKHAVDVVVLASQDGVGGVVARETVVDREPHVGLTRAVPCEPPTCTCV